MRFTWNLSYESVSHASPFMDLSILWWTHITCLACSFVCFFSRRTVQLRKTFKINKINIHNLLASHKHHQARTKNEGVPRHFHWSCYIHIFNVYIYPFPATLTNLMIYHNYWQPDPGDDHSNLYVPYSFNYFLYINVQTTYIKWEENKLQK